MLECTHYDVREVVFKACDGDKNWWSAHTYSVFWAEHVTIWKHMGCSPYLGAHGTHPLLPLNIAESNYLLPLPASSLTSTELISHWAISLQKHPGNWQGYMTKSTVHEYRLWSTDTTWDHAKAWIYAFCLLNPAKLCKTNWFAPAMLQAKDVDDI